MFNPKYSKGILVYQIWINDSFIMLGVGVFCNVYDSLFDERPNFSDLIRVL